LAKKETLPGGALLPTVGEPGTYEWCEEVVECMNAAWRSRETADQGFMAAVRAALQFRIWETLSPPPPAEPYTSLDGLIRRTADEGQAENMQIAIRFSGVLDEARSTTDDEQAPPWAEPAQAAPTRSVAGGNLAAAAPGTGGRVNASAPNRPLSEEEEIALGNALLDQFAGQSGVTLPTGDQGGDEASYSAMAPGPAPAAPRLSAAQRKRERLERTHPDLAEAVDAGELTLKQAYVQAGIEKEVKTLDKLQRLWRAASEDERDHFLSWIEAEQGIEKRREYEREVYGDRESE
jgi:hypothetical protein